MLFPTQVAGRARGKLGTVVGERLASEVRGSLPVLGIDVEQPLQPRFSDLDVQPLQATRLPHTLLFADFTWINTNGLRTDTFGWPAAVPEIVQNWVS